MDHISNMHCIDSDLLFQVRPHHDPAGHLPPRQGVRLQEGQERRARHQALLRLVGRSGQSVSWMNQ